jgi:hypothetical protein
MKLKMLMILCTLFVFTTAMAQTGSWERLGTRPVDYKLDRDVVHVGAKKGGFTKLKIAVDGGSLNMHRMVITYGNGTKESIDMRHSFRPNSASRVIDIQGGKRVIQDITFFYDTKNLAHSKAVLTVFGRH